MKTTIGAILSVVICFWISGCSDTKNPKEVTKTTGADDVKLLPLYLLDSADHFYGNDNWMIIGDKKDTSYLCFSRQVSPDIRVYHYDLVNGDSVNSRESKISLEGDRLHWKTEGKDYMLKNISGTRYSWISDSDSMVYSLKKPGELLVDKAGRKFSMIKTLTLSDFLVRSHYDWVHGTRYAFDTVNFNRLLHEQKKSTDKNRNLINQGKN